MKAANVIIETRVNLLKRFTIEEDKARKKLKSLSDKCYETSYDSKEREEAERNKEQASTELHKFMKKTEKLERMLPLINRNVLYEFLEEFLIKETGKEYKRFSNMSRYYAMNHDYDEECLDNIYFFGLKCVDKEFKSFKAITEGIKNKEVILFETDFSGFYHSKNYSNLFSFSPDNYYYKNSSDYYKKQLPKLTLFGFKDKTLDYLKLYPNLKSALIDFSSQQYIKRENDRLNYNKVNGSEFEDKIKDYTRYLENNKKQTQKRQAYINILNKNIEVTDKGPAL
jgi:hypothetical protein